MRTKPILFNTDMVRALQANRKTVTRRVVKPQPKGCLTLCDGGYPYRDTDSIAESVKTYHVFRPPYRFGDILYVRETWAPWPDLFDEFPQYIYRADYSEEVLKMDCDSGEVGSDFPACVKWRPSIHMPREAARIFLRVTGVRVERLQDITEEQAQAEGLYNGWALAERSTPACTARQAFMWVWDMTIKPADRALYGWIANPWVWVIEFERCEKPKGVQHGNPARTGL